MFNAAGDVPVPGDRPDNAVVSVRHGGDWLDLLFVETVPTDAGATALAAYVGLNVKAKINCYTR